jgi:hypothetical protein
VILGGADVNLRESRAAVQWRTGIDNAAASPDEVEALNEERIREMQGKRKR